MSIGLHGLPFKAQQILVEASQRIGWDFVPGAPSIEMIHYAQSASVDLVQKWNYLLT